MQKGYKMLLNLDQFGSEAKLTVREDQQHKTFLGATVSLTIIIFILYSFILLMNDMLYNQVPSVLQIEKFNPNPDEYQLTTDNFYFAASIVNNYGIPIIQSLNETIFTAEAVNCHRSSMIKDNQPFYESVCKTFVMVPCYEANLNPALMKKVNPPAQLFNLLYCINSTEWNQTGLALQGTGQSPEFQTLNIRMKPCNNDTVKGTGKTCASQDIIDANLNQGWVAIAFPDRILDQQATGDPYNSVNKLIVTAITNTQTNNKNMFVNLRHSYTNSFKNFFYYFGSEVQNHELVFNNVQESTESTNMTQILGCLFQLDDRQYIYQRNYYDVLRVLGNLGGLVNLLIFLGALVMKPISKLSLDLNLVNQIFSFQNAEVSSKAKQSMRASNAIILKEITIASTTFKEKKTFIKDMDYLKGFFERKLHSLRLGISDYMFHCFKNPKTKQIQVGVQKLNQKLDVIFLIKKLIEIDKLKILLLNSEQLKLFDYIPKPHIPLGTEEEMEDIPLIYKSEDFEMNTARKEFDLFQVEKQFVDHVQEAFEAYKTITSRHIDDKISLKLIELMDSEIKLLFNQTLNSQQRQNPRKYTKVK